MPRFRYTASTPEGERISAGVEATSRDAAEAIVRARGLRLHALSRDWASGFDPRGRLRTSDVVMFTRQFASLMDAGIGLDPALTILYQQLDHERMKEVVYDVRLEVGQGRQLSEAISRHPTVFPPIYTAMVIAGEAQGNFVETLNQVADYMETQDRLVKRVKGMLLYPVSVLFGLILTVGFMLYFVMPNFATLFEGTVELPLLTAIMFQASDILRESPWIILVALGSFAGLIIWVQKSALLRSVIDRYGVKVPVVGPIVMKAAVSRFARTMSASISAGVGMVDAFDLCAETSGNVVISQAIRDARESVQDGELVHQALKQTGYFPPMAVSLIAVGQEHGRLDEMLDRVADNFEDEVDRLVDLAMEMLKPAIIIILGVVVGAVLVAIYGPMWQAIQSASELTY